mmetsp:Transcript_95268/g.211804  ORF Transcript_95268/g.211804 Transcript_95268/m.211804 type:complete len:224 (+) Transcript_95268:91-762(+)
MSGIRVISVSATKASFVARALRAAASEARVLRRIWVAKPPQEALVLDETVAFQVGEHEELVYFLLAQGHVAFLHEDVAEVNQRNVAVLVDIQHLEGVDEGGIILLAEELLRHDMPELILVDLAIAVLVDVIDEHLDVVDIAKRINGLKGFLELLRGDKVGFVLEGIEGHIDDLLLLWRQLRAGACPVHAAVAGCGEAARSVPLLVAIDAAAASAAPASAEAFH